MIITREELKALHQRPGLARDVRYLASIEALIALGEEHLLHEVFALAFEDDVPLQDIYEVMLQACIFCGFPRTINGFAVLRRFLKEYGKNGEEIPPRRDDRTPEQMELAGMDLFRTIYRYNHMEVLRALREDHPELPLWIVQDIYGKVLSRPRLGPKTRELAAVAALTVSRVFPQLLSHIKGGLNLGADRGEVREVIRQMEPYSCEDTVRRALRILNLGTKRTVTPPINEAL